MVGSPTILIIEIIMKIKIIVILFALPLLTCGQSVKLTLLKPQHLWDCKFIVFHSCDYVKGWSNNGITPDSLDFQAAKGWNFRSIKDGEFVKVYRLKELNQRDTCPVFSFPYYEKPHKTNKRNSSPLIENKSNKDEFFLCHNYFVPKDSLRKYISIWPSRTSGPLRMAIVGSDTLSFALSNKEPMFVVCGPEGYHRTERKNGILYKRDYHLSDTVYLNQQHYRIEDIDSSYTTITLLPVKVEALSDTIKANPLVTTAISNLFKEKKYILIDCWATWCNPCIKSLPQLLEICEHESDWLSFVSVCQDLKDKSEKANLIWKENHMTIPLIDDFINGHSITKLLEIKFFPSYILMDKDGNILFQKEGNVDFPKWVQNMKKNLKFR